MALPPFQTLLDSHGRDVHRFLIANVGPVDADDCWQETWLSALRAYPSLKDASNLRAWVFTIAHRKTIDQSGRAAAAASGRRGGRTGVGGPGDGDRAAREELWSSVAQLPDKQRIAVTLRFLIDSSYGEIAEVMGTSEEAARRNVHEALKRLRKELNHERDRRPGAAAGCARAPGWPRSRPTCRRPRRGRDAGRRLRDDRFAPWPAAAGEHRTGTGARRLPRLRRARAVLQSLADRVSPRMLEAPRRLDGPRRELDDYFGGRRREFDLPLDRRLMSDFMRRVLSATATIPFGSVSTYGAVAREAGSPRGSRAAGNALGSNPMPIVIPCHRVLHADGGIGGYTGGLDRKRTLLELESRASAD